MTTRDREPESPGPLKYAPKWARMAAPETGGSEPRLANTRWPGPLKYAPKWARMAGPEIERGSEPRLANSRPPDDRPPPPPRRREPAPPRKLTMSKGSFEGDVAVKNLPA